MAAPTAIRPVACVAALNAIVQGLLGVVLGVLGLCVSFCVLGSPPQATGNDFAQYITFYFQGDECGNQKYQLFTGVTGPTPLRIWLALSLFFSASMLVSSFILFIAVARSWSNEKLQITLVSWLFINTFIAVDDVILSYVFGNDYLTALDSTSQQNSVGPLTLALVTFLVGRGVYLWLLNLVFILYLYHSARRLHKFLNQKEVLHNIRQPVENWPTLDDFGKSKSAEIERTPTAINPQLANRMKRTDSERFPEHSAMARWPALNGETQTLRDSYPRETNREQRSRVMREPSYRRQSGIENPVYESDIYYLRLQNETGSSRDFEERRGSRSRRDSRDRSRREVIDESTSGHYRSTIPPPPAPSQGYIDENGIPIPPIDYHLDPPENPSTNRANRPLSLQEAILDRTLRLKKVPDELKRGIQK